MEHERLGLDGFCDDIAAWRAATGARVPVYDRLLAELQDLVAAPVTPDEIAARSRVQAAWQGRAFSAAYDRPLLFLAAVREAAAARGPAHPLWAAVVQEPPQVEASSRAAITVALTGADPSLDTTLATRWVQTNETSRAVAWLWPAWLCGVGTNAADRPLALFDVGASAGLNLVGADLPAPWTTSGGAPVPTAHRPRFVARAGFDARPLDVTRAEDVAWLRACVWPGEPERLARLDQALAAMAAASTEDAPPRLHAADAADVPARLETFAGSTPAEALTIAYQTLVFDYLPPGVRATYTAGMRRWLAQGRPGTRVWIELETSLRPEREMPAGLEAEFLGPEGALQTLTLARTSYHPRTLAVDEGAVAAFVAACGPR